MLTFVCVVWTAQKEIDDKRGLERAKQMRDDQAAFNAEAERRRAEVRAASQ